MEIDLRRLAPLVSQPQSDDFDRDARLEESHCRGVPERMRRDPFRTKRWAELGRPCHVLGDNGLDTVRAERAASEAGEEWIGHYPWLFMQP